MQFKYIVATIASLAVSNAIATPVAMPAAESEMELTRRATMAALQKEADQSTHVIQELSSQMGARLQEEADKNYKNGQKVPTIEEIEQLKQHMESRKNGKRDASAEPQYGWNNWNNYAYTNQCFQCGNGFNWQYSLGWQAQFPFWSYASLYNNNIWNFYTGFGAYCGGGWGYC